MKKTMTQRMGFFGVLVASLVMLGGLAQAQVPQLINYQGVLKNGGGTPITGTVSVVFSLYDVASGGTALWSETQSVVVTGGLFNVLLGSSTAFPAYPFQGTNPNRYLGVKVGSDPEMTPRQRLVSVGYTLKAEDAETLGDRLVITDKVNGRVGIGTATPSSVLHMPNQNTSPVRGLTIGQHNSGAHGAPLIAQKSRGTYLAPQAVQDGDYALGLVSQFYDGTSYIKSGAIGFRLDGTPSLGMAPVSIDFVTGTTCCIGPTAYGPTRMTIKPDGKVGIGTEFPTELLQVAGNVRATAFLTGSSRELKKGITPLGQGDYSKIMEQINDLKMVRYLYKTEDNRQPHLGVIAEESPKEILDETGKAVSLSDYAGFILAGLKAQSEEIQALKANIQDLESRLLDAEGRQDLARVE